MTPLSRTMAARGGASTQIPESTTDSISVSEECEPVRLPAESISPDLAMIQAQNLLSPERTLVRVDEAMPASLNLLTPIDPFISELFADYAGNYYHSQVGCAGWKLLHRSCEMLPR